MYTGEHSVTFTNSSGTSKNSWTDWFLIPSSRPVIKPPSVKTKYLESSTSNKEIDLTEYLCDEPKYSASEGSLEFIVENGHVTWSTLYSDIMDFLHGKKIKMTFSDDSTCYYEGRMAVSQWKSGEQYSTITIDYTVYRHTNS